MWTFLGAYGTFYRTGVAFFAFPFWQIGLISPLIYFAGTRIWLLGRRYGFITPSDLMGDYYGSKAIHLMVAIIGIIAIFPYAAVQLVGAGKAFVGLTGGEVPYWVGLALGIAAVGISTNIGGLRAVGWSDVVQGLFFGVAMWLLMFYIISYAGGLGEIFNFAVNKNPKLVIHSGTGWPSFVNQVMMWGLGFVFLPHMWQRWYAGKSAKVISRAAVFTPFWNCIAMTVPVFVVGIAAHKVMGDLTVAQSDMILPLFFSQHAPMVGLIVVAGAFAAGMSSLNSMLLTCGALFTEDIYHKYFNPGASPAKRYNAGRIFVAVLAVVMFLFSLNDAGTSLLIPLSNIGASIATVVVPAAIGPLFWPRATKTAATWSIILASINMIIQFWVPSIKALYPTLGGWGVSPVPSSFVIGLVTLVVLSYFTKPLPYSKQVEYHRYLYSRMYRASAASTYEP